MAASIVCVPPAEKKIESVKQSELALAVGRPKMRYRVDGPQIRNADDEKEAYRSGGVQKRLSLGQSKAFGNAAHK